MIHQIENQLLSVSILQTGAEICSIKSKASQQEYMWGGDEAVWGSHAPVLFPIIGCLKGGEYTYKGKVYSIPKHGFIRNNNKLEVEDKSANSLTLKFQYNEDTLKMYPFKFEFYITFMLDDNKLVVNHKVVNVGEDDMLFSLGAHPGFACPFNEGEEYEDYFIAFEEVETASTCKVSDAGLTNGETAPVLNHTNQLPLTKDIFNEDALIFKQLKSRKATLKSKHNDRGIAVSYPDFDYLGIWAKPGAPFVCIEPWLGITDDVASTGDFAEKDGVIKLATSKTYDAAFTIEIEE